MARVAKQVRFDDNTTGTLLFESDPDGNLYMVSGVATEPPTELASANVLVVGTTAAALSTISGGIPSGATHAILANLHATNTIYYTLHSAATPVATSGSEVGIPLTSLDVTEVQNLSSVKVIATAATTRMYVAFRKI